MSATRPPAYEDRYAAPVEASRRGAHRARPAAVSAILPIVGGVAVVLIVIGTAYTLLGGNKSGSSGDTGGTAAGPTTSASAQPSAGTGSAGNEAGTGSAGNTVGTTPAVTGKVNKQTKVLVVNSIGVTGLAGHVIQDLNAKSWNNTDHANSTANLPVTKIFYGKSSQQASAVAVQKIIGFGEVEKDATQSGTGITIVLGQDAQQ